MNELTKLLGYSYQVESFYDLARDIWGNTSYNSNYNIGSNVIRLHTLNCIIELRPGDVLVGLSGHYSSIVITESQM